MKKKKFWKIPSYYAQIEWQIRELNNYNKFINKKIKINNLLTDVFLKLHNLPEQFYLLPLEMQDKIIEYKLGWYEFEYISF
jgi:hypothetical protein